MVGSESPLSLLVAAGDSYSRVELGSGWWVALLGWPAIAGASVAFSLAIDRRSRWLAIVGWVLAAPMFLYLSLTPRFAFLAPLALVLLGVLGFRIERSSRLVSCALALPAAGILLVLAFSLLTG